MKAKERKDSYGHSDNQIKERSGNQDPAENKHCDNFRVVIILFIIRPGTVHLSTFHIFEDREPIVCLPNRMGP